MKTQRPIPRPWAEPVSLEEYTSFTPHRIDVVAGNLLDSEEERLDLLALLLKNCGLEAAGMLCDKEGWREAADRAGP